jgi:AraC family transcriptional regulator
MTPWSTVFETLRFFELFHPDIDPIPHPDALSGQCGRSAKHSMGAVIVFSWKGEMKTGEYAALLGLPVLDLKIESFQSLEQNPDLPTERDADLALIDCGADAAAGLAMLREIKLGRPDVPIILITRASSEDVVLNAYKNGAREFFREPFDHLEFRETVERILHFKRNEGGDKNLPSYKPALPLRVPERLRRAVGYMEKNLTAALPLEKIAEAACLSKFHFCRQFKKHFGKTPIQFMLDLRIHHAGALLRDTRLSIGTVATRTGFRDLSSFHKQFKRVYRCTPSVYRKSVQSKNFSLSG